MFWPNHSFRSSTSACPSKTTMASWPAPSSGASSNIWLFLVWTGIVVLFWNKFAWQLCLLCNCLVFSAIFLKVRPIIVASFAHCQLSNLCSNEITSKQRTFIPLANWFSGTIFARRRLWEYKNFPKRCFSDSSENSFQRVFHSRAISWHWQMLSLWTQRLRRWWRCGQRRWWTGRALQEDARRSWVRTGRGWQPQRGLSEMPLVWNREQRSWSRYVQPARQVVLWPVYTLAVQVLQGRGFWLGKPWLHLLRSRAPRSRRVLYAIIKWMCHCVSKRIFCRLSMQHSRSQPSKHTFQHAISKWMLHRRCQLNPCRLSLPYS